MNKVVDLNPSAYRCHFVHGEGRRWAETNCYMDVVIELVHSLGFEPVAALAPTVSIDFDIDQWTFFKFDHADLLEMYGIEVHELNPWRSIPDHVEEQVEAGRPVLIELDSYFLPDTEGSAYRLAHVKSTVAVNQISVKDQHMGYFHGQGYYHLDGADFRAVYQLDGLAHERMLPPYVEFAKLHKRPDDIDRDVLVNQSKRSLIRQLDLLPAQNPFSRFRERFEADLEWLMNEPIESFHGYSFATLRQYGACFELVETYLTWLAGRERRDLGDAIDRFGNISALAKQFQFKLARSVARGKALDLSPIDEMGEAWKDGTDALLTAYS